MADSRLRIKFGEHEFEAEGPAEAIQDHFRLFRKLVAPETESEQPQQQTAVAVSQKIMRTRGKILFLAVPAKPTDAVLALMLGQRQFRKNNAVTGVEIMRGLRHSEIRIPRVDGILSKHRETGHIQWAGTGRGRRYSLTDAGAARAEEIVRHLAR